MRIGVDARFLTHPQLGGFKTYTRNLVNALAAIDAANDYVVYVDRSPGEDAVPLAANFASHVLRATTPAIGMPVREQILLPRCAARHRLDILHCLCNTAPIRLETKHVLTLHDAIQVTSRPRLLAARNRAAVRAWAITTYSRLAISRSARSAARVITPSRYEAEEIVRHLQIPRERVEVTALAADPIFHFADDGLRHAWRAEARGHYGLPERFVLGIGYEARKNIPLLIEAFAHVASRHRSVGLVIVVAVEERRHAFMRLVRDLGLGGRALMLKSMGPSALVRLYNLADMLVFPSERESFGLPPLEAMSCGLPTIAMNATSIPEVVRDAGVLIDGRDPRKWGEAIESLLDDAATREELVRRGLERASELTWRRCAEKTLEIYNDVAAER